MINGGLVVPAAADPGAFAPVGLAVAVLLGAATQRITGLGFSLVASPFVVLILGAFTGVLVINALGIATSALVLAQVWRDVDVRRALLLAVPALLAVVPGAWVAQHAPAAILQIVVGACVVVALLAVYAVDRHPPRRALDPPAGIARSRWPAAWAAGTASGFMNAAAGVGGPAVTVYAVATGWQHRAFAATAQLYFFVVGGASLLAKGLPSMPVHAWATAAGALAAGLVVGRILHRRISPGTARNAAVMLALLGGVVTLAKGLADYPR